MKKIFLLILVLFLITGCSSGSDYKPVHINCNDYDCDGEYGCPSTCRELQETGQLREYREPTNYREY